LDVGLREIWIISKNLDFLVDKRGIRSIMDAITESVAAASPSKEGTAKTP
jgi:hypothetical protein